MLQFRVQDVLYSTLSFRPILRNSQFEINSFRIRTKSTLAMVTLSSYNGFLFIHSLSTAFSAISVIVNVVTIIRYIVKPNSRQPRMILLAIHCNFVFSFVAFIHSAYMVLLLDGR